MSDPAISVIIPTYNRAGLLRSALSGWWQRIGWLRYLLAEDDRLGRIEEERRGRLPEHRAAANAGQQRRPRERSNPALWPEASKTWLSHTIDPLMSQRSRHPRGFAGPPHCSDFIVKR